MHSNLQIYTGRKLWFFFLYEEKMKYVSQAKYQESENWVTMIKQNSDRWIAPRDKGNSNIFLTQ